MAEQKRYYWLRLQHDFFKSLRIKKLRKLAGGDTFTIIYLKMQLKCLVDDGYWYFKGIESTFEEEVALDIDEDVENVRLTIQYLLSCGLMEITDEPNTYLMPYVVENTGSEGASAQRVREHRNRQKALHCNPNVTQVKQLCYVEKEKEIEKEKDKEIEKDTPPLSPSRGKETLLDMFNRLSEDKQLSEPLKDKLREWMQYKKERKEGYKETGLKSFLTQMEKHEQRYGSSALIDCIDLCMASNYKGIITDLITEKKKPTNIDDEWKGIK